MKQTLFPLLGAGLLLIAACSPVTKDDYIKQFSAFIEKVEQESADYSQADWDKADTRYDYFNEKLHERFRDDLALKDQFKIGTYRLRYEAYRGSNTVVRDWDSFVNSKEVKELREEIKRYVEEDLDDDLEKFVEEAERIGEEVGVEVKKLVEEIARDLERER